MEETKVVEMETKETEEVVEMKESKVKKALGAVGSGIKKHWKPIAIGAGAFVAGIIIGSKKVSDAEDYEDEDCYEVEESDEIEPSGDDQNV